MQITKRMSNIHIPDSYKVRKRDFKAVLATFTDAEAQEVKAHRSMYSMKCEIIVHNFLYHWGIQRERTKDCDIDYPCDRSPWIYCVLGTILWIFTP